MTRPKKIHTDLPPRMSRRANKTTVNYYYRCSDGKFIPLGNDLAEAKIKWAELENGAQVKTLLQHVLAKYLAQIIPKKSPKTQKEQTRQIGVLIEAFGHIPPAALKPMHIRQYLDARTAAVSANREIALLSHAYNKGREWGMIDAPNPCAGVERHPEAPRETYVTDAMFNAVRAHAAPEMQDLMDLISLTGLRPADACTLLWSGIQDGFIHVRTGKTTARLAIRIIGELAELLQRIKSRPILGRTIIATPVGRGLTKTMRRDRFDDARAAAAVSDPTLANWQLRDIRAKAATETETLQAASELLGHTTTTTTKRVYRRGTKVNPVR